MTPLHELFNRIRWDPEFGCGEFRIGYLDHLCDKLVYVPFQDVQHDPESHFCLNVTDAEGVTHSVPFHRIKEVWKDGALIWHREH